MCALIIHFRASRFAWTTELSHNRKWMRCNVCCAIGALTTFSIYCPPRYLCQCNSHTDTQKEGTKKENTVFFAAARQKRVLIGCDEDHVDYVDINSATMYWCNIFRILIFHASAATKWCVVCPTNFYSWNKFPHKFCIDVCGFASHHLSRFSLERYLVSFLFIFFSSLSFHRCGSQLNVVPLVCKLLSYSSFGWSTPEFSHILCDGMRQCFAFASAFFMHPSIPS